MTKHASFPHPAAIVLGCGEVGSAVAFALHQAGLAVVLADEADPSCHRRGMAFTNAWYVGNAELGERRGVFLRVAQEHPFHSRPADDRGDDLVVAGCGRLSGTDVARGRTWAQTPPLRCPARPRSVTIGIGSGFVGGENVDVAIADPAEIPADVAGSRPDTRIRRTPGHAAGVGSASTFAVEAPRHGRFMTERRIGDLVRAGQIVGGLGNEAMRRAHRRCAARSLRARRPR